eukprot:228190_1
MSFLSKGKKPGYRDSPLTHILKDSLGGNSKTIMFVACSPHIYNRNETIRALRFAQTAKKVKNKAKKNEEQSAASLKKRIKELELQVSSLEAQLVEARGRKSVFKKAISRMVVDDGLGNRSLSLRIPPGFVSHVAAGNRKPGPLPYRTNSEGAPYHSPHSPYSPVNVPATITEEKQPSPLSPKHPVMRPNAASISMSMENMIIAQASVDHEEWSGSDNDEAEVVYSDGEEELVEELLKEDDAGEEELNYIHEISELRRKLEDALKSNNTLNDQITSKNIELEHCNNQIAQLVEEVDEARNERVSAAAGAGAGAPSRSAFQNEVPNYDSDAFSDEQSPLPPIPLAQHVVASTSGVSTVLDVPPIERFIGKQASVMDGHTKLDSGFSFGTDQNNTMLKYLMELQTSVQDAKQDMMDLKHSVQEHNTERSRYSTQYYISEEDEDSAESSAAREEEREEEINLALRGKLNNKNKSCWSAAFGCFAMDNTGNEDTTNTSVTALLVEEYLKTHVRAEMKKQSRKEKRKQKKRRRVKHSLSKRMTDRSRTDALSLNQGTAEASYTYNFDNEELPVLSTSPTHTPTPVMDLDSAVAISFQSDSGILAGIRESEDTRYSLLVDSLGDSRRNVVMPKKTKPGQRNSRV